MTDYGRFTGAHELLDILRRRQAEIGLSNEALEEMCDLSGGTVNKYLGPSREKWPGMDAVFRLMYALGLSGSLHVDMAKVEKMTPAWRRAGRKKLAAIRAENPRVSREMLKRAAPLVLSEFGRRANEIRWERATPSERKQVGKWLAVQRRKKRRPGT